MGPIRCPETSVKDYHSTLRNTPEERRSQVQIRCAFNSSSVTLRCRMVTLSVVDDLTNNMLVYLLSISIPNFAFLVLVGLQFLLSNHVTLQSTIAVVKLWSPDL
jgi:hypothetical protein